MLLSMFSITSMNDISIDVESTEAAKSDMTNHI